MSTAGPYPGRCEGSDRAPDVPVGGSEPLASTRPSMSDPSPAVEDTQRARFGDALAGDGEEPPGTWDTLQLVLAVVHEMEI